MRRRVGCLGRHPVGRPSSGGGGPCECFKLCFSAQISGGYRLTSCSRRLGLCCWSTEELPQRKAVLCKFAELSQQVILFLIRRSAKNRELIIQVFNTSRSVVSFLKEEMDVTYRADVSSQLVSELSRCQCGYDMLTVAIQPNYPTVLRPYLDVGSAHAVGWQGEHQVTVCADMATDWRYATNVHRLQTGARVSIVEERKGSTRD